MNREIAHRRALHPSEDEDTNRAHAFQQLCDHARLLEDLFRVEDRLTERCERHLEALYREKFAVRNSNLPTATKESKAALLAAQGLATPCSMHPPEGKIACTIQS